MAAPEGTPVIVQQHISGDHNVVTGTGDVFVEQKIVQSAALLLQQETLAALLQHVRRDWVVPFLEDPLYQPALLSLEKEDVPGALWQQRERLYAVAHGAEAPLPPDAPLIDVFERPEVKHALLILGGPGSGKTTALIELARDLCACAATVLAAPPAPRSSGALPLVPLLFELASWKGPPQTLLDWLLDRMALRYGLSKEMGAALLQHKRIVLLLDGLDEVRTEHHQACIAAINAYGSEQGVNNLVVCSRHAAYEACRREEVLLNLHAAVLLKPLSPQKVESYLARAGTSLGALQEVYRADPGLREMAETPLLLNMMTVAYRGKGIEALTGAALDTQQERRAHVFDTYIERMFERYERKQTALREPGASPLFTYGREQTLESLAWLAARMAAHNQVTLYLEELQPSWLTTRGLRILYTFSTRMVEGLVVGSILGFVLSLAYGLLFRSYDLVFPLLAGLGFGGLVGVINGGLESVRLDRKAQREEKPPRLPAMVTAALLYGSSYALVGAAVVSGFVLPGAEYAVVGALFGLIFGIIMGLFTARHEKKRGLQHDIHPVELLNWSWRGVVQRSRRGFLWGGVVGLTLALGAGLVLALLTSNWGQVIELLPFGLAGVPIGGLIGATFGGWQKEEVPERVHPGEGIRHSLRNALEGGLVVGALAILLGWLLLTALLPLLHGYDVTFSVYRRFLSALAIGVFLGPLALLWFGGLDLLRHYVLRGLLRFHPAAPRRFVPFLDYAARLVLLRQAGGGYSFMHGLVQDHFAGLGAPPEPPRQGASSSEAGPEAAEDAARLEQRATSSVGPARI